MTPPTGSTGPWKRLNEGLPQKGKRLSQCGQVSQCGQASMKGFPRRGSDFHPAYREKAGCTVSLNEGLPQKGKR